jgi:hypothetical protein
MKYTLSYYRPQSTTVLVRRPWWAFWRHDTLEHKQALTRFVFADIPDDEAKILIPGFHSAGARLAKRLMGADATMLQLEQGQSAPMYVPATGHHVEAAGHNMLPNSEPRCPHGFSNPLECEACEDEMSDAERSRHFDAGRCA